MKKCIMLGLAALMSVGMMAQNEGRRFDRAKMIKNRTEQLVKELELKGETKTSFETTYEQYANELMGEQSAREPREGGQQAEGRHGRRGEKMTDEQATERLQQMFDRQERQIADQQRRLETQKKYVAEFQKFLTPQQILRVLQTPNMRQYQRPAGMNGQRPGPVNGGYRGGMGGGGFGGHQGGFDGGDF